MADGRGLDWLLIWASLQLFTSLVHSCISAIVAQLGENNVVSIELHTLQPTTLFGTDKLHVGRYSHQKIRNTSILLYPSTNSTE